MTNTVNKIKIYSKIEDIRKKIKEYQKQEKLIGLVPTMGALHKGHLSLIERSVKETNKTIVTIFVNPTQFGPNEDLAKYPRTLDSDIKACQDIGVNIIFAPELGEMYPENKKLIYTVVPPIIYTNKLCGEFRPGHFEGVATIVTKLFNIIPADIAYFGQKDAQQLFIIKKMVEQLNIPIEIKTCQTVRESDGLACSSRNLNLDCESRKKAPLLFKTLNFIKTSYEQGNLDFESIKDIALREIIHNDTKIHLEYLLAFDYNTLEPVFKLKTNTLIAIAAKIGGVRLIDNIILN